MVIVNDKIQNIYPLTPLQNGMLFHNLYEKESSAYLIQLEIKIEKNIEIGSIKKALKLLSDRYSVLRTFFVHEKVKEPCQVVLKERELEFEYVDLSDRIETDKNNTVKEILSLDVKRGFDLQNDPLLRLKCIKLSDKENIFIFTNHHIIMDGWCNTILFKELFNYYERLNKGESYDTIHDEIIQNNEIGYDYGDYLKWLGKQPKGEAEKYWAEELEGYDNECDIKPIVKPEATEDQIREFSFELDHDTTEKL
ncbi:MAG: hypothetical protein IJM38_03210, partial [Ruminococcus sp.]|nr:hypothetical protein [Ruminococcus sp.]